MSHTVEVDIRELVCPQSIAVVRRCLAEIEPGERLRVVGANPAEARSIRRTCHKHGYEVRTESREPKVERSEKEGLVLILSV